MTTHVNIQAETQAETQAPLTLEQMRIDIARLVNEAPEELELDDNLLDWGLDSMRIFNVSVEWNKTGLELRFADLAETPTLDGWWEIVQRQQRDLAAGKDLLAMANAAGGAR
ncbi:phosphopantetheine-binding protein [Oceanisphaera avium]|uniref:Carrier domain-containing protein n=1 Tax=Oceanisphaera avium TaxID=1903694 RepID=A0A1Y0CWD7_9GAMM|nr:phosphopantetheine-binding protein [Oceanisphaera avium]ART79670.1 hypothetical protein CBP12_05480 [Oceanisphaera avium]